MLTRYQQLEKCKGFALLYKFFDTLNIIEIVDVPAVFKLFIMLIVIVSFYAISRHQF